MKLIAKHNIYSALFFLLFIALWQITTMFQWINPLFLPTPLETANTLYLQLITNGELWPDVFATLYRTVIAFVLAAIAGIGIGLVLGYSKLVHSSMGTAVDFARSIPATALFPLFLLFFGIGDEAKIAVGVWAASLIIMVNTAYGVRHANKVRQMVARAYKLPQLETFKKLILPEAAPHIAAGLRIALSLTLIVVIVTEMFIGTNVGLGHRIIDAQLVYRVPEMYAAIIMAGILGYALNHVFQIAERKTIHWSGR